MTLSRTAAPVLLAVTLLGGAVACGGDGGGGDGGSEPAADGSLEPGSIPTSDGDQCDIEAELTGAVEASWSGDASLSTSEAVGPPAFYQTSHDGVIVSVYAAGNGFEPSVIIGRGPDTWVTTGDAGLEIDPGGGGAEVDADAVVPMGEEAVRVTASITC